MNSMDIENERFVPLAVGWVAQLGAVDTEEI